MYQYFAQVVRWKDGDTVVLKVDLGYGLSMEWTYRVYRIDTPETSETLYKEATDRANELAPPGAQVVIRSIKNKNNVDIQTFGRWVAEVYVNGESVGETLLKEGLAEVFEK